MDTVTYFVALPFQQTEDGELVPGEPKECQSSSQAAREAERLSRTHTGAVAFSRSGDGPAPASEAAATSNQDGRASAPDSRLFEVLELWPHQESFRFGHEDATRSRAASSRAAAGLSKCPRSIFRQPAFSVGWLHASRECFSTADGVSYFATTTPWPR